MTLADVSQRQDGSHLRETYLSVIIADRDVARIMAVTPDGEEPYGHDASFIGIPVDAGTVGFVDVEAVERCMPDAVWFDEVFDNDTDESWFSLLDSADHLREGSANIVMPLATDGENVVLTHSGWGDGVYPVLKTYDADGNLLGVHIDLFVDEREDDDEAEPAIETETTPEPTPAEAAANPGGPVPPSWEAPKVGFLSRLFNRR